MLESDRVRFARPALTWSDLWEIPFYLVSLAGMVVLVVLGCVAIAVGLSLPGGLIVSAGVVVGAPVLFALLTDAKVFAKGLLRLVGGLVVMPFPAWRRRWRNLWEAKPGEPGEISYINMTALSIEDEWNRTTVVVHRFDDDPIAIVATGAAGRRLRRALPDVPVPRTILRRGWRSDPRYRDIA